MLVFNNRFKFRKGFETFFLFKGKELEKYREVKNLKKVGYSEVYFAEEFYLLSEGCGFMKSKGG